MYRPLDESAYRIVRELFERDYAITSPPDAASRARQHVYRTLAELEMTGWFQGAEQGEIEVLRVEYDKFAPKAQ